MRVIQISLRKRSRSLLFLFAIGCVSGFLAAETSLVGTALSFNRPSVGRRVLAVDPDDAQLQYRLSQAYQGIDPAESLRRLRRAAELSPYSRFYWSTLASVCESRGDFECADRATERMLKLCPMVPYYHWQAVKSDLRAHRLDDSLAEVRRLVELDPTYADQAWPPLRTAFGPDVIFQKVLAGNTDSPTQVGYADFLSQRGDNDAAYRIWRLVAANARAFPFASAQPYLERLIGLGRIDEAARVWQDLERLGIVKTSGANEKDNVVFNGDFEQLPLNAGFDWRWSGQFNYLALDFAASGAYHGGHCLEIDFTASHNEEYEPVYQVVLVLPNHTYRLNAYVRSEAITSDTGPSLRVRDTQQSGFPDAVSETMVGTTPWHEVSLYFSTAPQTRSVRLSVWRARGRVFPTEITGSFWLDAVSLKSEIRN